MKSFAELKNLVQDLHGINGKRVYSELIIIAIVTWSSYLAIFFVHSLLLKILFFFLSSITLYRGLSFNHEVSHFERMLPRFELIYNILFGIPSRVPAYSLKTHNYHHGIKTFGTSKDPEYENWTEKKAYYLLRPLLLSLIYPTILTARFAFIPIFYPVLSNRSKKNIHEKISSFVMNAKFKRPYSEKDYRDMIIQDLSCLAYFVIFTAITISYGVFKMAFGIWYLQIVFISLMNTHRALVAHRYQAHKVDPVQSARDLQVNDSVTIEGSFLTEIWAPIGLRYHSTHHMFPSIPYYNLGAAHRRIKAAIDADHSYNKTIETNFFVAYFKLIASCR